jgi:hypothetical protein
MSSVYTRIFYLREIIGHREGRSPTAELEVSVHHCGAIPSAGDVLREETVREQQNQKYAVILLILLASSYR